MTRLLEKIVTEIGNHGPIAFARFMELALYCPVYGYYEKEGDTVGRRGDFYTSVSVGSLFGQLLACQFAQWLEELEARAISAEEESINRGHAARGRGCSSGPARESKTERAPPLQLVEAGAHRGQLAHDILEWLREFRPRLFGRIEYWLIEPSERRRQRQQLELAQFPDQVRWAADLNELGADAGGATGSTSPSVHGIIFSNELLDAFSVHRWKWNAARREWVEWGVRWSAGRLCWTPLAPSSSASEGASRTRAGMNAAPEYPSPGLTDALPDGFTLDNSPAAAQWWGEAASVLRSGKLLTLDYGLTADELVVPERKDGTLRAYFRHQLNPDVLANPGEQDITAHVNFTALQQAGESAGLTTELFASQAQFLTQLAAPIWKGERTFGEWTATSTRQFQTLTHPEHLGRAFRVLVQSRA